MSELIRPTISSVAMPLPELPIAVRPALPNDLGFIDGLQKIHTKQVGWMPTKQLEGKIAGGDVLVAEEVASDQLPVASEEKAEAAGICLPLATGSRQLATPLGYCIAHDQYFKRDDVGIIYQMNVVPGKQRGLIGATLLKAQFQRSAYGCKLYCCWCAQDIAANRFWEAMGFVPLAFRTGSETKSRTHIFWQKRIRQGDTTTPWWFPSQTSAGSIREDRLVLPIPPGVKWSAVMPMVLPGEAVGGRQQAVGGEKKELSGPPTAYRVPPTAPKAKQSFSLASTALRFGPVKTVDDVNTKASRTKTPRVKTHKVKRKNDPAHVAAARELRDRWLEEVNAGRYTIEAAGKYDVARGLEGPQTGATMRKRIAA